MKSYPTHLHDPIRSFRIDFRISALISQASLFSFSFQNPNKLFRNLFAVCSFLKGSGIPDSTFQISVSFSLHARALYTDP